MNWTRIDDYSGKSGDYIIAECFVEGCSMWRCSYRKEIFAHAENKEDAKQRCEKHAEEMSK